MPGLGIRTIVVEKRMFSRLFNARIKAAEAALKSERLDEAFRLASAADLRDNRQAAAVLLTLAERLFQRARQRFADEQFTEALLDLDKAEVAGAPSDKVAELRAQVRVVADEVNRQDRSRRARLEAARDRIDKGSLLAGRRMLEQAPQDDAEAQRLKRHAEDRQEQADRLYREAERLLDQGQLSAAVERFRRAKSLHPNAPTCAALESRLCAAVLTRVREAFESGRPRGAADDLAILADLGRDTSSRREIEEALRWIRESAQALRAWQVDAARQGVLRLLNLHPKVAWLRKAADDLKVLDERLMALQSGPLGERWDDAKIPSPAGQARTAAGLDETVLLAKAPSDMGLLPERLLLIIDGGGSFLLHRGDRVSIGRAASSHPADVAVFSDLAEHHADVARTEEDYFLFSPREVQVNGVVTRQALLQDGDRLVMGRKARFIFRTPSRRSASAVLELSDGTRMADDVRRVILFRGHALIGVGPTIHATCTTARRPLVLYERAGQLWLRPESSAADPGTAIPVPLGESVEVEGIRLIVKEARRPNGLVPGSGGRMA
ncbi:MAG: hypothetical protein JXB13_00425 [Phycisphaerae bacterium]|nr:hypothetical protein [Phycisphaerae bacterium]